MTKESDPLELALANYAKQVKEIEAIEAQILEIRRQIEIADELTPTQLRALEIIRAEGPILGKTVAKRLDIKWHTLKTHVLPGLRSHGVTNDKNGKGYYIPSR